MKILKDLQKSLELLLKPNEQQLLGSLAPRRKNMKK